MSYQAILFDLDDTLYDLRGYWTGRLERALHPVLLRNPQFERDALVRQAIAEKVYIPRFSSFLRSHGVDDDELIATAQNVFEREWFTQLELHDDAVETLEALRAHFNLGLITNGPSSTQRAKITQFQLADYFDLLIVSEEVGVAKPDPAIFQIAVDHFNILPHKTLYVGDSIEFDLLGALAAGMPFIWMNPRGETLPTDLPRPLAEIRRLHELPALLAPSPERASS